MLEMDGGGDLKISNEESTESVASGKIFLVVEDGGGKVEVQLGGVVARTEVNREERGDVVDSIAEVVQVG